MQNLGNISIEGKGQKKENKEETLTLIRSPHSKHNTHRPTKKFIRSNKVWFLFAMIAFLISWIYFVPPNSSLAVIPFIFLLSSTCSILFSFFGKKAHVFSTLFIFIFLLMSYFIGFDIINTLVLLSFIIGLSTLFNITRN